MAWAFALLAALATGAHAEWVDRQGAAIPETDDRKSAGDFGAQLVLVADEQALFKAWAAPSATVDFKTAQSVAVGQPINAFVIFSGCKPAADGQCHVSMRFRVLQPDGTVHSQTPAMEVWHDKPAPRAGTLELSVKYLKIVVERHEQQGRYTIQAQVRDDHTGLLLPLQKAFNVTALRPAQKAGPADQRTPRGKGTHSP